MKAILRLFFHLLYHQFAFTYDLVAAAVSFNHWKQWVLSVAPFTEGPRVLEMGHGPGHLQHLLLERGLEAIGIDESVQMGRLAKRNLQRRSRSSQGLFAYTQISLTRAIAQNLPFANGTFNSIVATFPTEYITAEETLGEVKRCLAPGGRLIVLPVALPRNRFLDWLFRVTRQRPTDALEIIQATLKQPFLAAGFETEIETVDVGTGILLIVLARKPKEGSSL
jgi:ubiquinone/menaquinone biosynthesis C-methylase UbiE